MSESHQRRLSRTFALCSGSRCARSACSGSRHSGRGRDGSCRSGGGRGSRGACGSVKTRRSGSGSIALRATLPSGMNETDKQRTVCLLMTRSTARWIAAGVVHLQEITHTEHQQAQCTTRTHAARRRRHRRETANAAARSGRFACKVTKHENHLSRSQARKYRVIELLPMPGGPRTVTSRC